MVRTNVEFSFITDTKLTVEQHSVLIDGIRDSILKATTADGGYGALQGAINSSGESLTIREDAQEYEHAKN